MNIVEKLLGKSSDKKIKGKYTEVPMYDANQIYQYIDLLCKFPYDKLLMVAQAMNTRKDIIPLEELQSWNQ